MVETAFVTDSAPDRALAHMSTLVRSAAAALRRGSPYDVTDEECDLALETLTSHARPVSQWRPEHQVAYLSCARYLADIYDKRGEYAQARRALLFLKVFPHRDSFADPEVAKELDWATWAQSVNLHRDGKLGTAEDLTKELLACATPETHGLLYLSRLNYAHGRHLQAQGSFVQAEACFTVSLEHAANLAEHSACSGDQDGLADARQQQAIVFIQAARLTLERGELQRAWRQLLTAQTLHAGIVDPLYKHYLKFLKGCVLRQQQKLDLAIEHLESAIGFFDRVGHLRYQLRAKYELALACFNRDSSLGMSNGGGKAFADAYLWLDRLEKTLLVSKGKYLGDERTRERWDVKRQILCARVAQGQGNLPKAGVLIDRALKALDSPALKDSSQALRTIALAVKGEILIDTGHWADAIALCEPWSERVKHDETVDRTDEGWIQLVIWKAYLTGNNLNSARAKQQEWNRRPEAVENVYIARFAETVKTLHASREDGFYISAQGSDTDHFHWKRRQAELKQWLVARARLALPDKQHKRDEQAHMLGVTSRWFKRWLSDIRKAERPNKNAGKNRR
jgi:tetratricopeptide (TPR) repeat protein